MNPIFRSSLPPCRKIQPARLALLAISLGALLFSTVATQAAIRAPYTVDADTLHLWHLNESTVPALDSAAGGTNLTVLANGANLNNPSFSGFGTALSTSAATNAYLAPLTYSGVASDNVLMTYA